MDHFFMDACYLMWPFIVLILFVFLYILNIQCISDGGFNLIVFFRLSSVWIVITWIFVNRYYIRLHDNYCWHIIFLEMKSFNLQFKYYYNLGFITWLKLRLWIYKNCLVFRFRNRDSDIKICLIFSIHLKYLYTIKNNKEYN